MIDLSKIVEHSNDRFLSEIEAAKKGKNADTARIERRKNETYFSRLGRACLGMSNNLQLSDQGLALSVSFPEVLFSKMFALGWNPSRKQKGVDDKPELLQKYYNIFNANYKLVDFNNLYSKINTSQFDSLLLCHGLSPTSDTILLLADIGRVLRMSHSIGLTKTKVLLADVTWVKYNRSINQLFKPKEFINQLRVCLDKRKRLYKALNLDYTTFGITDFNTDLHNLNKKEIVEHAKSFRDLAFLFWGNDSLKPHTSDMQKLIGKKLNQFASRDIKKLPPIISKIIQLKQGEIASAIEEKLVSELKILRTISELFSTFDEEIFLYYFAQYFAQSHFNDYLKIAPLSEEKFDQPFSKYAEDFDRVARKKEIGNKLENSGYIYCPQYKLGSFEILPYTSISGDVVKNVKVDEFKSKTILLEDSYDNKIDKIIGVITTTEIPHRNRLVSDLLSFVHILIQNFDSDLRSPILESIKIVSEPIYSQMNSKNDTPQNYLNIFSDWIKSISSTTSVTPFHIIPYLWEEEDWNQDRVISVSKFILTILETVNDVCD